MLDEKQAIALQLEDATAEAGEEVCSQNLKVVVLVSRLVFLLHVHNWTFIGKDV